MVSKLSSLFRQIIYKDDSQLPSSSRKRRNSGHLNDNVEQDVLETPQVKRAKLRDTTDKTSSRSPNQESTLVRVASWIKVKTTSFGGKYMFRPIENGSDGTLEDGSDSTLEDVSDSTLEGNEQHNVPGRSKAPDEHPQEGIKIFTHNAKKVTENSSRNTHRPQHRKETFAKPEAPALHDLSRRSIHRGKITDHQNSHDLPGLHDLSGLHNLPGSYDLPGSHDLPESHDLPGSSHRGSIASHQFHTEVRRSSESKPSHQSMRSQMSRPSDHDRWRPPNSRQSTSVHDRIFSTSNTSTSSAVNRGHQDQFSRRTGLSSAVNRGHRDRFSRTSIMSTATECFRLDAKQKYQELLQQFTTVNVSMTHKPTPMTLNRTKEVVVRQPEERNAENTTFIDMHYKRLSVPAPSQSKYHSTRVLPHQYETKRDIREAARNRLHQPVTDLSPVSPAYTRRIATPAQPDFNSKSDRSDSPVLLEVRIVSKKTPLTSRFQKFEQSVQGSPYVDEKWVQEIKEKFESSVRITRREAEEQTTRMQLLQEKKAEEQARALEKARAQLIAAEKDSAIDLDLEFPLIEDDLEPEIEEEVLPELTLEMKEEIDRVLIPRPPEEVLVEGYRLSIKRMDFQTLKGLNWLNDEIINFYMNLLMERSEQESLPSVHAFNTFFYGKLLKDGYMSLRRWTKKVDVFSKDLLVVPIHLGVHWCVAIIDFRTKSISYYDSMGGDNNQCLDALRNYLNEEHKDKKKAPYDLTGWTYTIAKEIPQQMNGSDCGVFACKFAEYVTRNVPVTFTQHDMPYFRRRMIWEILHKKLL